MDEFDLFDVTHIVSYADGTHDTFTGSFRSMEEYVSALRAIADSIEVELEKEGEDDDDETVRH